MGKIDIGGDLCIEVFDNAAPNPDAYICGTSVTHIPTGIKVTCNDPVGKTVQKARAIQLLKDELIRCGNISTCSL